MRKSALGLHPSSESSRGFAMLHQTKGNPTYYYDLKERPDGFYWVKTDRNGKIISERKMSKSTRNYMWAEGKAKKHFRKDIAEAVKKKKYRSTYSSMWSEPNPKYAPWTEKDLDKLEGQS